MLKCGNIEIDTHKIEYIRHIRNDYIKIYTTDGKVYNLSGLEARQFEIELNEVINKSSSMNRES